LIARSLRSIVFTLLSLLIYVARFIACRALAPLASSAKKMLLAIPADNRNVNSKKVILLKELADVLSDADKPKLLSRLARLMEMTFGLRRVFIRQICYQKR